MRFINSMLLAATLSLTATVASGGAFAEGDPEQGEKDFRRCGACHTVDEGVNRVGPSLFNVIGRQAGTAPDYSFSDSYVTAGEQGLIWTEELLITYLEDPKAFLIEYLGTDDVSTKMRNKFRKLELRENIAAYLGSITTNELPEDVDMSEDAEMSEDGEMSDDDSMSDSDAEESEDETSTE